jgi:menaquinol-cytochrome c reductase iron-sulfur subunit
MTEPIDRRHLVRALLTGAGVTALGYQGAVLLRSVAPNVSYEAATVVKLGAPVEFPEGLRFLRDERLFVIREGNRFHAISAVCTHLGCTVQAEITVEGSATSIDARQTHRFVCPCHGSKYDGEGACTAGPAPRPLPWRHLSFAADDGQLVVDLAREVPRGVRLELHA